MIYNPFMPSIRFVDHAVFGGGGGGAPAPAPVPVLPPAPVSQNLTSTFPELIGEFFFDLQALNNREQEIIAQREAAALAAKQKTEAETAATTAKEYASGISSDVNTAAINAQAESNRLNLEVSSLRSQIANGPKEGEEGHNPELQNTLSAKEKELEAAVRKATDIGQIQAGELRAGQRDILVKSATDPTSLISKPVVDTIDPNATGTSVSTTAGQVTGTTPQAGKPQIPRPDLPIIMGRSPSGRPEDIRGFYSDLQPSPALRDDAQVTGQQQIASGFLPAFPPPTKPTPLGVGQTTAAPSPVDIAASTMDADQRSAQVQSITQGLTGEQGTVSTQVDAATGTLSEGAIPNAATMDPNYIKEVTSGTRNVSSDEIAKAQGLSEEAVKTQIAQANTPDNIIAAQTTVQPNEIPQAAEIAESDMAQAVAITSDGLAEDAVAVATKMKSFSVDAGTLAEFKEGKIEARDTVQGQLALLMKQFDDGTPAWAAGAMRAANATMASRGLGASSMASAAIIQASMEAALPIASADANAFREMKLNNLNRQQQIALTNAAAQQGVELQNFSAEQAAMLQNSQNAFSVQTQNLSNMQSAVLANAQIKAALQGQNLSNQQQANLVEAARYAEVNNLNLNNVQQSLLQDSANNLQVSLANLSSKQQAYVANAQLEAALQGKQIDNQQQVAILNAAKFSEANNLTFTARQQAEINNSELMKTIGLAELSSKQAATLQGAAAIASMDMVNLSNQQQAAVENAKNFLQMDMANLSNAQQTTMFNAQSNIQALFTDQAAENAARQFNASSENQTKQFMSNLHAQVNQFNAEQKNAMSQFNAGEENALDKFNTSMKEQRNQFNAQNALAVAQSNAQWRQNVATLNTAAQNEANMLAAAVSNQFTQANMDQLWQRERDLMDYAFKASESDKSRHLELLIADKQAAADALKTENANKNSRNQLLAYALFM